MELFFGFDSLPPSGRSVVTVGSFDGVHCGHRILLDETVRRARACGGESVVMTFEPHPRITLGDSDGLRLLTTLDEKALLLERAGIDRLVVIPFDEAFSRLSAEEFLSEYVVGKVGAVELVAGYNHRFGRDKSGDHACAERAVPTLRVTEVAQQFVGGGRVSSTIVRRTIADAGDMAGAVRLLGHPYIIIGMPGADGVIRTDKYKLLPPAGTCAALCNGRECMINIDCEHGTISRDGGFAPVKTILEL